MQTSCTPSAFEYLVDVVAAILVRRLEILEFLSQIFNVRFQLRCLARQPPVDLGYGAENKPTNDKLTWKSRDWVTHDNSMDGKVVQRQKEQIRRAYILPTPS